MASLTFAPDRLIVSELFESVQGEGPSVGLPSTFLRLGFCNLQCGFCDTKYTWDFANYDRDAELRAREVWPLAQAICEGAPETLVITGGEPMLQQEAIVALIDAMDEHRMLRIEVETAGTIPPAPELMMRVDQWNVSPKLASSGNALEKRRVDAALLAFAALDSATFKFVVTGPSDLREIDQMAEELALSPEKVTFMPEGTTAQRIAEGARALLPECIARGVRLGYRLHVALFDDERGV